MSKAAKTAKRASRLLQAEAPACSVWVKKNNAG